MKLAPMMEVKKTVLLTFFKDPQRHVNNAVEKQTNKIIKTGNPNLLLFPNVLFMGCFYILWHFLKMGDFG